jgi:hypothetical protein
MCRGTHASRARTLKKRLAASPLQRNLYKDKPHACTTHQEAGVWGVGGGAGSA